MADPRWQTQKTNSAEASPRSAGSAASSRQSSSLLIQATENSADLSGGGELPRRSRPVQRSGSFTKERDASVSIVFNSNWVKITQPIGGGAFSCVFGGVYTNPETGDESIVAVKILKTNMLKRRCAWGSVVRILAVSFLKPPYRAAL